MSDEKKPRKKTGGRMAGVPNKRTLIGRSVSETLKNWLGFDDDSVARTGMIDGKGYAGREKLRAMFDDQRPVDPQYVALCKFLFSYAYGTPAKHVIDKVQKDPLIFVAQHGYLPWDARVDPGHQRSLDLIAGKARRRSSAPSRPRTPRSSNRSPRARPSRSLFRRPPQIPRPIDERADEADPLPRPLSAPGVLGR